MCVLFDIMLQLAPVNPTSGYSTNLRNSTISSAHTPLTPSVTNNIEIWTPAEFDRKIFAYFLVEVTGDSCI